MHRELKHPVTIHVDGTPIQAEAGALLIKVLLEHGIAIPHFCYHEALGADGNCRMCMVGIEGAKRPQIACDTFIKDGMRVNTQSEAILKVKQEILELELVNHPVDCPICDQAGECKLQDYYMEFGLYASRLDTPKNLKGKHIDLGSSVMLDQERCVLCARCTRFTQKVTKTHELAIVGRGDHAHVATAPGRPLNNPYAMNVVDLCPVGALTSKDFRFRQRVWFLDSVKGICHGCAKGCNLWIDHNQPKYAEDRIYRFRPRVNEAVNSHFLCDAGRLSYKAHTHALGEQAMVYGDTVTTEDALTTLRNHLTAHRMVLIADASLSLEQLATLQRFCDDRNLPLFAEGDEDETFGDGWLRQNDRSANQAALTLLGIATDVVACHTALEHAEVVITVNRPLPKCDAHHIAFTTHPFEGDTTAAMLLPFADYTMDSGTLINCDGRLQRFETSLKQEHPVPTLLQWLHRFDAMLPATSDEAWSKLLHHLPELKMVNYHAIPDDGIVLKGASHA